MPNERMPLSFCGAIESTVNQVPSRVTEHRLQSRPHRCLIRLLQMAAMIESRCVSARDPSTLARNTAVAAAPVGVRPSDM